MYSFLNIMAVMCELWCVLLLHAAKVDGHGGARDGGVLLARDGLHPFCGSKQELRLNSFQTSTNSSSIALKLLLARAFY